MEGEIESVVRIAPHRAPVEAWALVLASQSIPHRLATVQREMPEAAIEAPAVYHFALMVPSHELHRATVALANTDAEDAERAQTPEAPPPDRGRPLAPVLVCLALTLWFVITGPRSISSIWFSSGSSDAAAITAGTWWRAVTGLTLHADVMHLFGNVVAMLVFLSAVSRWLGGGLAVLLTLLAGFAGNLSTAFAYGSHHNSVGASTATFAALGLLGGLQARHRVRYGWWHRARRVGRAWPMVAACIALFAMLGVGEDKSVDVVAHATGLGWGVVLGLMAAWLPQPGKRLNLVYGLVAGVSVLGCWLWALRAVA